jgi:GT2 family glycosyltransferase
VPIGNVSIVIPTWNGRHLLEEFLPSVEAAAVEYRTRTGAVVEIVVVDDGSTDGTVGWIHGRAVAAGVDLRIVVVQDNSGFAAAANRGLREARHDLVLLLNNDLAIAPDAIAPLVAHFKDDRLFAVHCRAIDAATSQPAGRAQSGAFRRGFLRVHDSYEPAPGVPGPFPSLFASGGSSMFDRERFLAIGGFDLLFAPYYYEDVELSYRAWKRGFSVHYEPASSVRHRFSSTIGRLPDPRIGRISFRNRLFLHWIHLHDRGWLLQHLIRLPAVWVAAAFTMRWHVVMGLLDAVSRLAEVRSRRRVERAEARRDDREVVALTRPPGGGNPKGE